MHSRGRSGRQHADLIAAVGETDVVMRALAIMVVPLAVMADRAMVLMLVVDMRSGLVHGGRRGVMSVDRVDDRDGIGSRAPQAAGEVDVERVLDRAGDDGTWIGGLDDQQVALGQVVRGAGRGSGDGGVTGVDELDDQALVVVLEQVPDRVQRSSERAVPRERLWDCLLYTSRAHE